jgi:putative transposase
MARKPRIHFDGALYHVMLRGNGGQEIFTSDWEREAFLALLAEGVERFGHLVCAFCLMGNHVHLAIRVAALPLSRIVQNLAFRYTRTFNRARGRTGHLFQGRYKAVLIDANSYLLELVRYVHLNPVRAGFVRNPEFWRWSSYGAYLGRVAVPWLDTAWVLTMFGADRAAARRRLAGFTREGLGESHREEFHRGPEDGRVLGKSEFTAMVLRPTGSAPAHSCSLDDVVTAVVASFAMEPGVLASHDKGRRAALARGVLAQLVLESSAGTLTQLAHLCHRDVSSLSSAATRVRQRARRNRALGQHIDALRASLEIP